MVRTLLGKKVGMTQVFTDGGKRVPVTVLRVGPCVVTQVKTPQTDQCAAVQIGFEQARRKNLSEPLLGHFEKAGVPPQKLLHDVQPDGEELPEVGAELRVDVFEGVSHVDVTGTSKGRGFAGVVKRHGFATAPKSHGGRFGRKGGSIGSSAYPGRVHKGKAMAGHMGAERVTVKNLKVVKVDREKDVLLVKGSVPGPNGGYVMVTRPETGS